MIAELLQDFSFTPNGDYKEEMETVVGKFEGVVEMYHVQERVRLTEELTDKYVEEVGERPDIDILSRLSDILMHEYISSTDQTKKTWDDAFLTESMYKNRIEDERHWDWAQNYGTDGRDYGEQTRLNKKKLRGEI